MFITFSLLFYFIVSVIKGLEANDDLVVNSTVCSVFSLIYHFSQKCLTQHICGCFVEYFV